MRKVLNGLIVFAVRFVLGSIGFGLGFIGIFWKRLENQFIWPLDEQFDAWLDSVEGSLKRPEARI